MKRSTIVWIALVCAFVIAQIFALIGIRKVFRGYRVPTGAMAPAIQPGEYVIARLTKKMARSDIVVFRFPRQPNTMFVSRIVALPGETVEIRNREVFIDGRRLNEPYVFHVDPTIYPNNPILPEPYRSRDQFGPLRVPPDHYFTLSDNRDHALDGRYWGPLDASFVTGRVVLVYSMSGMRRP